MWGATNLLEERLMIRLFHDLLNFVPKYTNPAYRHSYFSGSQDITLGVHAEKIEDLLRVKCWLSNKENSSTFETVL